MFVQNSNFKNKKISDIVGNDYRYAKALDSFGVDFVLDILASNILIPILRNNIPPAILNACVVMS